MVGNRSAGRMSYHYLPTDGIWDDRTPLQSESGGVADTSSNFYAIGYTRAASVTSPSYARRQMARDGRLTCKDVKMRSRIAISGAMVGLMISLWISTSMAQASEVWVQQARGRISGGATVAEENKPANAAPEGSSTNAAASGSPSNPATCNQQNASSPACYSATQQTKGK